MRNREEELSLLPSLFVFLSRISSISASWRGSGASGERGAVRGGKDQHSASHVRDVASEEGEGKGEGEWGRGYR